LITNAFLLFLFLSFSFYLGFTCLPRCGRVGLTRKNGTGCLCHSEQPFSNVYIGIEGPDSVIAGTTVNYRVVLFGGPDSAGGANIAAFRGEIHSIDSTLCEDDSELTYAFPHPRPVEGLISWHFSYTAPLTLGFDTIYSVGNSVNLDSLPEGDQWNFGENFPIKIVGAVSVAEHNTEPFPFQLFQNFPNPFNPITVIHYSLSVNGFISMKIYDVFGNEVAELVSQNLSAGNHEVEWNASNAPSGMYFYRLSVMKDVRSFFSETKKLVLLK